MKGQNQKKGIVMLAIASVALSLLLKPSECLAQTTNKNSEILQFKILGPEKVCVGNRIVLHAQLKNVGKRTVTVDTSSFWRYVTEKALDQSSTLLSSVPLNVPKMRGTIGDGLPNQIDTSKLVELKPNRRYLVSRAIDTSKDSFYRNSGHYSVSSLYEVSNNSATSGKKVFAAKIDSPEFLFVVVDCNSSR